jgi:hypothetical protein
MVWGDRWSMRVLGEDAGIMLGFSHLGLCTTNPRAQGELAQWGGDVTITFSHLPGQPLENQDAQFKLDGGAQNFTSNPLQAAPLSCLERRDGPDPTLRESLVDPPPPSSCHRAVKRSCHSQIQSKRNSVKNQKHSPQPASGLNWDWGGKPYLWTHKASLYPNPPPKTQLNS